MVDRRSNNRIILLTVAITMSLSIPTGALIAGPLPPACRLGMAVFLDEGLPLETRAIHQQVNTRIWPGKLFQNIKASKQVIVVSSPEARGFRAILCAYERNLGSFRRVIGPADAVLGRSGFAVDKVEGDGATPVGIYRLGTSFGTEPEPEDLSWPYRRTGQNDYWIDDPA